MFYSSSWDFLSLQLPDSLFGGAAGPSSLRYLRLSGGVLPWVSPLLGSKLVLLEIPSMKKRIGSGELSEMFDALERMTAPLEELISRLELEGSAVNVLHRNRVPLTTLRSLELHAKLADAGIFLAHLALPVDVHVQGHLDCTGSKESHTRA